MVDKNYTSTDVGDKLGMSGSLAKLLMDGWIAQGDKSPVRTYRIPGSQDRRAVSQDFDAYLRKLEIPESARYLTTGEAAGYLNVTPRSITNWMKKGFLTGFRIPFSKGTGPGDRRIPVEDVIEGMIDFGFSIPMELERYLRPEDQELDKKLNEEADRFEKQLEKKVA